MIVGSFAVSCLIFFPFYSLFTTPIQKGKPVEIDWWWFIITIL